MTSAAILLETISRTRARLDAEPALAAQLARLQGWQLSRLRRTYADFFTQARYRDGLEFFVNDLYGPHDYARRDQELRRVLGMFEKLLPAPAILALIAALELEALSQELDMSMLAYLDEAAITDLTYAYAYCCVGRRLDRQRQIGLIVASGRALNDIVQRPAIGLAIRAARRPARLLGVVVLQDFLERGYQAFAKMQDAEPLLAVIERRETAILNNLFAAAEKPFAWEQA